jgi:hypothetical protein
MRLYIGITLFRLVSKPNKLIGSLSKLNGGFNLSCDRSVKSIFLKNECCLISIESLEYPRRFLGCIKLIIHQSKIILLEGTLHLLRDTQVMVQVYL